MKKHVLILATLMFISCKNVGVEPADLKKIYFEEPQPINDTELKKIPSKYLGTYYSNDSIFLNIDKNIIAYQNNYNVNIHQNMLDSLKDEIILRENKFFLKSTKEVLKSKKFGDSITLTLTYRDTIFEFSQRQKAKRINGKLILSTKDSLYWKIKILTLDKNFITIQQLDANTDLQMIDSLTKIKSKQTKDSNLVVKPTRSEFAKILDIENLGRSSTFTKVKK